MLACHEYPAGKICAKRTHLVHTNIQGVMRLCVYLEFDFRRSQAEGPSISAALSQSFGSLIHSTQISTQLILQPRVIDF